MCDGIYLLQALLVCLRTPQCAGIHCKDTLLFLLSLLSALDMTGSAEFLKAWRKESTSMRFTTFEQLSFESSIEVVACIMASASVLQCVQCFPVGILKVLGLPVCIRHRYQHPQKPLGFMYKAASFQAVRPSSFASIGWSGKYWYLLVCMRVFVCLLLASGGMAVRSSMALIGVDLYIYSTGHY